MAKSSIAHYKVRANREELIWLETEAAAAEGRCRAQLSEQAHAYVKAREEAEYRTPSERLDFWLKVEAGMSDGGAKRLHAEATAGDQERRQLYSLAREVVQQRQCWTAGEQRAIFTGSNGGREFTAYIRHTSRELLLGLSSDGLTTAELTVSKLNLARGPFWPWIVTPESYELWAIEARAFVRNGR